MNFTIDLSSDASQVFSLGDCSKVDAVNIDVQWSDVNTTDGLLSVVQKADNSDESDWNIVPSLTVPLNAASGSQSMTYNEPVGLVGLQLVKNTATAGTINVVITFKD